MSKMSVQVRVGNAFVRGEGDTPLEVFENVAAISEVFQDSKCRACGSEDIIYRVRTAGDGKKVYRFPEAVCQNQKCRAKLSYGQTDDGVIYPKRFKMEGKEYVLDGTGKKVIAGSYGWVQFSKDTD